MTNAAYALAETLERWRVPASNSIWTARGFNSDPLEGYRNVARTLDLVSELDQTLQGMRTAGEKIHMFEPTLHRWYEAVLQTQQSWSTGFPNAYAGFEVSDLALLEALGALLEAGAPLLIGEAERRTLADVLAEARTLIEDESPNLTIDVRRYLWSLIVQAQTVVADIDNFGDEAVRHIALELGGALYSRGETIDHNGDKAKGSRWKSTATFLMLAFATSATDQTVQLAVREVPKLLPGGGN